MINSSEYCDISKISVCRINKSTAKAMILKHHYTHSWSLCQVAYGIYYNTGEKLEFIDCDNTKLIGCIVYGCPVGRSAAASISDKLNIDEVYELIRLFIFDGYGKNIESYCIGQSFKLLNAEFPKIKCILSYADGEQGHTGTIYKATGFLYQGNSSFKLMPTYSLSLTGPPNYNWMHSRTVFSTYGGTNIEHLKRVINRTFWKKKESSKHRYIKFISNKVDNKRLIASMKHPAQPYPTSCNYVEDIEQIVVENKDLVSFF